MTLSIRKPKTDQWVFNKVVKHLITQNQKSLYKAENGGVELQCAYRGLDGLQCAAGCLIPDKWYTPALEGSTVDGVEVRAILQRAGIRNLKLISTLQTIHDDYDPDAWKQMLRDFAKEYNLKIPRILREVKP